VSNATDKKTGLPLISLYGSNKKPSAEQLADVDVVIFDIRTWACGSTPTSARCTT
jgi:uncharacterized protein YbbC (DUF1343 family)